jgi:uncharacterized protein (DUF305 family)
MSILPANRRTRMLARPAAVLLAAGVALGGCAVDSNPMAGHMGDAGAGPGRGMLAGQGLRGMGGMMAPRDEADYLLTMVPHHREAILAAESLTRSQHPQLRRLGRSIRTTQAQQVRLMQRWIDRWYPQATPASDYLPMMSDLSGLSGDDLDRTFLTEMVHHHMMAVMMSRHLLRSGLVRHPAVAGLAESVIDEQSAEIVQMRNWLRQWSPDRAGR